VSAPIYQVITPVDCQRGGITRSVLRRARLLSASLGRPVHVLSFEFNPNFDLTLAELAENGLIDKGVTIHNFFEDLARIRRQVGGDTAIDLATGPANRLEQKYGTQIREVRSASGTLTHLNHLDASGGLVAVEYFDAAGSLRRVDLRDPARKRTSRSQFLLEDSRPYVVVEYDTTTGICTWAGLVDPALPSVVLKHYANLAAMHIEWLQSYADEHDESFFLTDYRNTDELVAELDRGRVAWVKTLHTNHLADPFVYGAPLRPRARVELGNADSFDALVLLSEQQRIDVARQFGPRTTYHVVNNPAPESSEPAGVDRDMLKAVGVGRYHQLKRWDYAITAFRAVVDAVPGAKLDIWGFGPAQSALQAHIVDLGLEGNVFLRGSSKDTARVFAGAAFSVLSSPAEGFPLVPLESMAVGTPVVAFNANYGLADQIESGVDGILVETGDTDALATAMIELFVDAEKCRAMGRTARRVTERLSEPAYVEAWIKVLDSAATQRRHRLRVGTPHAAVTSARAGTDSVEVEGTIAFDSIPEDLEVALFVRTRERSDDRYYPADACTRIDQRNLAFRASVPVKDLAGPSEKWDFYVSCSARNSHAFTRMSAAPSAGFTRKRLGASIVRPYRTDAGNFSIKMVPYRSLAQRAARRLNGAIGR